MKKMKFGAMMMAALVSAPMLLSGCGQEPSAPEATSNPSEASDASDVSQESQGEPASEPQAAAEDAPWLTPFEGICSPVSLWLHLRLISTLSRHISLRLHLCPVNVLP